MICISFFRRAICSEKELAIVKIPVLFLKNNQSGEGIIKMWKVFKFFQF